MLYRQNQRLDNIHSCCLVFNAFTFFCVFYRSTGILETTTLGGIRYRLFGGMCFSCGVRGICCHLQRLLFAAIEHYLSYCNLSVPVLNRLQLWLSF